MSASNICILRAVGAMLLAILSATAWCQPSCQGYDFSTWKAATGREAAFCVSSLSNGFSLAQCNTASCQATQQWRQSKPFRPEEAPPLLARLKTDFEQAVPSDFLSAEGGVFDSSLADIITRLSVLDTAAFANPREGGLRDVVNREWAYNPASGVLFEGRAAGKIDLRAFLQRSCDGATADRCKTALAEAANLVLYSSLVQVVATTFLNDERAQGAAYVDMLDKRWATYFDASRFQYPWELLVNSMRYKRGATAGFASPPEDQWILLHPSVGFRYAGGSDRKLDQALVLELAGYYRWRWNGSQAEDLWGGSLVASWSGTAESRRRGGGLMIHMPKNYSIGLIRESGPSGHKYAFLLSLDLGKLIQDPGSQKQAFVGGR